MQLTKTYEKSDLKGAFVGATVTGFSKGSLKVSFKLDIDEKKMSEGYIQYTLSPKSLPHIALH